MRNKFLEKETLMTGISEACDSLCLSDFNDLVSHSAKCFATLQPSQNDTGVSTKRTSCSNYVNLFSFNFGFHTNFHLASTLVSYPNIL
ncbi:hypothetical protein RO3G_04320 [Rhizopus delemar RA 99-880]|uniref:Uncharacterized protein n=1 Tax=Rhizopus delemar (strain RA 99-880 / ATCC MYA-4621 / FGSC 9543 / NRRL 43880) TaxID=246409 RepID=I1BTT5_RHIO9|nr:hypothetical protein RO3G_04320 [Rhizopus delemar RA 99-880]|eukprot:EIE79615.1 hypothetical protein RO3G_04320 [Rhizopus delemar RA 99-880]